MNNNDCYHVKMAAFHELQEALNIIYQSICYRVYFGLSIMQRKTILPYLRKTKLQKYQTKYYLSDETNNKRKSQSDAMIQNHIIKNE